MQTHVIPSEAVSIFCRWVYKLYWQFQGGAFVVVYSNCNCVSARFLLVFDDLLILFRTSAGKELTSWLSACAFLLYAVLILLLYGVLILVLYAVLIFVCVFLSRMASWEEGGVSLYRFLIIAFSSTFPAFCKDVTFKMTEFYVLSTDWP